MQRVITRATLLLLALTVIMTSLWVRDVTGGEINVDCVLCNSRCELQHCICRNDCIRGTGNDCKRVNLDNLIGRARTCVEKCDRDMTSCKQNNCTKIC